MQIIFEGLLFLIRKKENGMKTDLEKIFNRQFKRLENELDGLNIPQGYKTVISKYWDFMKEDVLNRIEENDGENNR